MLHRDFAGNVERNTPADAIVVFSTYAEGDARDEVFAETVLEAFEDFAASVADDFIEPRAAVHRNEQGAFVNAGRLRMGGDGRVDEVVPDLHHFSFGAAFVDAHVRQHARHDVAGGAGVDGAGFFQRRNIHAAPRRQDAFASVRSGQTGTERADRERTIH